MASQEDDACDEDVDYDDDVDYVSHRLEHAPGDDFWDHFSTDFYDRVHEEQVSLEAPEPEVITFTDDTPAAKAFGNELSSDSDGDGPEEGGDGGDDDDAGAGGAPPPPTPTNLAVVENWSLGISSARSDRRAAWKGSRWISRTVLPAVDCSPRRHFAG